LKSLDAGYRAVVVGASGGIGRAIVERLAADDAIGQVHALSRSSSAPTGRLIVAGHIDAEDERSIEAAAATITGEIDLLFIALGILSDGATLRPEKSWRQLDAQAMARVYRINAIAPALCLKHFLPKLPRARRGLAAALSARVGSIADNRLGGWHSYRASKAALNMLIKNAAIELRIRHKQAVCVGLHPGTVDTALSAPFQAGVPADKLFTPSHSADRLLDVLDDLGPEDSGFVFDYAGQRLPA